MTSEHIEILEILSPQTYNNTPTKTYKKQKTTKTYKKNQQKKPPLNSPRMEHFEELIENICFAVTF